MRQVLSRIQFPLEREIIILKSLSTVLLYKCLYHVCADRGFHADANRGAKSVQECIICKQSALFQNE